MKTISLVIFSILFLTACKKPDDGTNPVADPNETVTIGSQVWMKRNLDVDHYRNGDPIQEANNRFQWQLVYTGIWCYFDYDSTNGPIFGKLYNWYAVKDPRGLAPQGFHIPSDSEWAVLVDYLGGTQKAGCKMKECGVEHWQSPNSGATNESGFTALPGGYREAPMLGGNILALGQAGAWWTTTQKDTTNEKAMLLSYELGMFFGIPPDSTYWGKSCGFSVRCIKDK